MRATSDLERFEALADYSMPLVINTRALLDSYALKIFYLLELASRARTMRPYYLDQAVKKAERMTKLISLTRARTIARHRDAIKVAQSGDIDKALELEKVRREKQARKEKRDQRKREIKLQEAVEKWRGGGDYCYSSRMYDYQVALRISKDGTNIETSHGATVQLSDAKRIYSIYKNGERITGKKVGAFTVIKSDDEFMNIGCHRIPITEVINVMEGVIK
jgi:hypothetical protein